MIKTRSSLFGTDQSVSRLVYLSIINDIKEKLGYAHDIYTVYDEEDNINKEKDRLGIIRDKTTVPNEKITATFQEESEDGYGVYMHTIKPTYRPIYVDDEIGAMFQPLHQRTKVTINFTYSSKSKSSVSALINRLKLMSVDESMYIMHDIEYSYTLGSRVLLLLDNINTLKNNYNDTQLELQEYIAKYFDKRVDIVNTIDGDRTNKISLSIREKQIGINGYIADEVYTIEKEKDEQNWLVSFSYEFFYEKPIALNMEYPILVYNQLINKDFLTFVETKGTRDDVYEHVNSDPYVVNANMSYRSRTIIAANNRPDYKRIPDVDSVELLKEPRFLSRVFSTLVVVNPNNKKELFNIVTSKELGLKDSILAMILSEYEYVTFPGQSMFVFKLYKDGNICSDNSLVMYKDGTLETVNDMDMRHTYRVTLSVVNDLSYLNDTVKKRILRKLQEQALESNFNTKVPLFKTKPKIDVNDNSKILLDNESKKLLPIKDIHNGKIVVNLTLNNELVKVENPNGEKVKVNIMFKDNGDMLTTTEVNNILVIKDEYNDYYLEYYVNDELRRTKADKADNGDVTATIPLKNKDGEYVDTFVYITNDNKVVTKVVLPLDDYEMETYVIEDESALDAYVDMFGPSEEAINEIVEDSNITINNMSDIVLKINDYKTAKPYLFQQSIITAKLLKE